MVSTSFSAASMTSKLLSISIVSRPLGSMVTAFTDAHGLHRTNVEFFNDAWVAENM